MPSTRISLFGTLLCLLWICAPSAFAQNADLGVIKAAPSTAAAGSNVPITYTLSVNNAGPDDAASVVLNDPLPTGITFTSITQNSGPTFSCTTPTVGTNGVVNCTLATMVSGTSATFTLVAAITTANPGDFYQNTATISSSTPDPNPENDSSPAGTQIPAPSADMYVTKSGPSAAPPNSDVTYTITAGNAGPDAAASVTLTDALPGTLTFVSINQNSGPAFSCATPAVGANGTITCTIASLPSGSAGVFTVVAHIPGATPSGTTFNNTATVSSTTNDPAPENNSNSSLFTVSSVDLSVIKTAPATVTAGQNVSYTVTLSNAGPDSAIQAAFVDTLPPGTSFVSAIQNTGPAGSCVENVSGQVTCAIANPLASGASAQFTIVASVAGNTPNGTVLTNSATTSTSSFDTNSGNNTATASTTVQNTANLGIVKSGPATVTTGTTVSYAITLSNAGPDVAGTPSFTDALPAGLSFVSITQNSGPVFNCSGGATTTCSRPSGLAAGASASFTLVASVSAALVNGSTVSNTANATSTGAPDPTPGNNTSTTNATVIFVAPPAVQTPALTWLGLLLLSTLLGLAAIRRREDFRR